MLMVRSLLERGEDKVGEGIFIVYVFLDVKKV